MSETTQDERQEGQPARKKGRERRRKILEAAKQKLISRGVDGLVLREIAEEMGITHGNLQYYFQTKDDLLKVIFDEEVRKFTDTLSLSIGSATTREGRISAMIDSSIALLESEETRLWLILFSVADRDPDLALILKRENDCYEEALGVELKKISPKLSNARRKHIAKIMRLMIDGLAIELIYADPKSPEILALKSEIKVVFNKLVEIS